MAKDMKGTVATAYVQILPTTAGIEANLSKEILPEVDSVGEKAGEQLGKKIGEKTKKSINLGAALQKSGQQIKKVGTSLTATVTAPLTGFGIAAGTAASNFESSMAKVQTIADPTEKSIGSMRSEIMKLSNQTGVSSTEIAEATYSAISAGQSTGDSIKFVANATKLAKAGFTDMGTATDTLTTALNAYGLSSDQVTSISDKLITTQNLGKTTVAELGSSLGKVIPTAAAFGVNLDQLSAAYVATTKNGIATAESGTYINSMLNELGASGTKASEALKEKTGKSFKELMDGGASLTEVLGILDQSAKDSGVSIMDMFGSQEAGKAAATLTQHAGDFDSAVKQMGDSAGTTEKAFSTMAGTSGASFEKMKASAQNSLIQIGSTILPMVVPAIDKLAGAAQKAATWWGNLDGKTKKLIITLGGIAAAVGPVLVVGGTLMSSIGKITGGVKTAGGAIGGIIGKLSGLGSSATTAAAPIQSAGTATGALSQNALGLVAAGAGILLASAGLFLLAQAAIQIAQAGAPAALAMGGLVVVMAGMAVGAAALAPELTAGAVGLVAFGAGVALIGAGAFLAAAGMSMMAPHLSTIAANGGSAAAAILKLSGSLLAFGGSSVVAAAGAAALGAGLLVAGAGGLIAGAGLVVAAAGATASGLGITLLKAGTAGLAPALTLIGTSATVCGAALVVLGASSAATGAMMLVLVAGAAAAGAGLIVFGAGAIAAGAGAVVLAAGLLAVKSEMKSIATSSKTAGSNLKGMVTSINVVKAGMSALKTAVNGAISNAVSAFKGGSTNIVASAKSMSTGMVTPIKTGGTQMVASMSASTRKMSSTASSEFNKIKRSVENGMNGAASATNTASGKMVSAFKGVPGAVGSYMDSTVKKVESGVSSIKSAADKASGAGSAISDAFKGVPGAVGDYMDSAVAKVQGAANTISKIGFHLNTSMALPHFSMSGAFNAQTKQVPSVSVSWYKEGGILMGPTIFGAMGGKLLGGGEAGPEAVLPLKKLKDYMQEVMGESREVNYTQNVNVYSPKQLSPSEVARQTRIANRQFILAQRGL